MTHRTPLRPPSPTCELWPLIWHMGVRDTVAIEPSVSTRRLFWVTKQSGWALSRLLADNDDGGGAEVRQLQHQSFSKWQKNLPLRKNPSFLHLHKKSNSNSRWTLTIETWKTMTIKRCWALPSAVCWGVLLIPGNRWSSQDPTFELCSWTSLDH